MPLKTLWRKFTSHEERFFKIVWLILHYGGPQLSQQNQTPHGKNKIPHGKTKYFPASGFWFCREVFCFCREVFGFAVRYFVFAVRFWVLPSCFYFCREVSGFAVTVVGHHRLFKVDTTKHNICILRACVKNSFCACLLHFQLHAQWKKQNMTTKA